MTIISVREEQPVQKHLILSDYHYANVQKREFDHGVLVERTEAVHDVTAMAAVETFMEWWRPTHVWYNGDMVDTHQVSSFTKENHDVEGLWDDIQGWKTTIERHEKILPPGTKKYYLLGNHEFRWEKYLIEHPPIRWNYGLTWEAMMDAPKLNMPVFPYTQRIRPIPDLIITHGELVGPVAGDTAKKYLNKYMCSGIVGHVHRLIILPKTIDDRTIRWAEGGCLCNLKPYYTNDPDWQQGITTLKVFADGHWTMQQAPISKGVLTYGGEEFSGE